MVPGRAKLLLIAALSLLLFVFAFFHCSTMQQQRDQHGCVYGSRTFQPLFQRQDLGPLLQSLGALRGVEIGVQRGIFSAEILAKWHKCQSYVLVDPWKHYAASKGEVYDDAANRGQKEQDALFESAKTLLNKWTDKTKFLRMGSEEAVLHFPDKYFDFIYLDGRHDYLSVQTELRLYWPKLKCGGIFAGNDFVNANEVPKSLGNWAVQNDGTLQKDGKAVRAAVVEFADAVGRQVQVTWGDRDRVGPFTDWIMRK